MKIAFHVAYFGKNYHGSQIQPNVKTIASELFRAFLSSHVLSKTDQKNIKFAARTDKGVSSIQQVVVIITEKIPIISQINHYLPSDIRVLGKKEVAHDFCPRKNATLRTYRYILWNQTYDMNLMSKAKERFLGVKSFHNFTKAREKNVIQSISDINIRINGDCIFIDISAKSFLWEQVRKISYLLKEIGSHAISINTIDHYFDPSCTKLVPSLPSENLVLLKIDYDDLKFEYDEKELNKFIKYVHKQHIKSYTCSTLLKEFCDFPWTT